MVQYEGELKEDSVVWKFQTTVKDGKDYNVKYYYSIIKIKGDMKKLEII